MDAPDRSRGEYFSMPSTEVGADVF